MNMTFLLLVALALAAGGEAGPRPVDGEGEPSHESATASYRGRRIRTVEIELEGGVAPEECRELVDLSPGELYEPEAIRRSIKQLFALGVFSDVKVAFRIKNNRSRWRGYICGT